VQDVFALLLDELPKFRYEPGKSFRSWLRTVTLNKWRENCRRQAAEPRPDGAIDWEAQPDPTADDELWEAEYHKHVARRALELMQTDFEPATWKAYWETVVEGRPATEVAAELGKTAGAIYAGNFRVEARLREELAGLMD
jgi:RNA polymerase sigma-70 factor, ECF subfamily